MWLYIPKTTSASTQVTADSISDSDSRIQMLAQSYTWNESFKQPRSWLTTLKRNSWTLHLFGLIPEPSTANRSLIEWIGSLEDSPASHSVSPESKTDSTMNAGSGLTSNDWFARYDREASSWKTSQASFMEELNTFSDRWPRSGSMRSGLLYERPTLVRPTDGIGSSSWPTVTTQEIAHPDAELTETGRRKTKDGESSRSLNLEDTTTQWQTPAAFQGKFRRQQNQTERTEELLPGQAQNWATPISSTRSHTPRSVDHGIQLANQADIWHTPRTTSRSHDAYGSWASPKASMLGAGNPERAGQSRLVDEVANWDSHQVQEATGVTSTNDTGRRLNPRFVTWLMGLPDRWLDFHVLLD